MNCYLGIDTSNYTTSLAVACDGEIIQNIKIPLPVKEGQRGLRQSDALFEHTVNLPSAFEKLGKYKFTAVGVSKTPRDNEGSYMPCFLAGVACAEAVARTNDIPLYSFSHQAGHIRAALYGSESTDLLGKEFLAFHISGGTTELLHIENSKITLVGGTLDINAGQLIDRTGVKLGIKFPCGPELEKLTAELPKKVRVCVKGLECNLSGAENKVDEMIKNGADKGDITGFVTKFIISTLDGITENALEKFGRLPLLYAGGVMSNGIIKNYFTEKYNARFSPAVFSSDNAAGTALLCEEKFEKENMSL